MAWAPARAGDRPLRARYARTLAESLDYSQVLPVLDRLETAHTATIEWLETRLAEVGAMIANG